MEVRCNRCGTEYEFDDVLISERGTTVKCTNCGFQFKVFAPGSRAAAPERWSVRTVAGEELVFGSLRDLQRGIAERRVGPQDLLSRGSDPPRRLGLIAELEPFFVVQNALPKGPIPRTLHGVAPEFPGVSSLPPAEPSHHSGGPSRPPHITPGPPQSGPPTLIEPVRPFDSRHGSAMPTLRTTPVPEQLPRGAVQPALAPEPSAPPVHHSHAPESGTRPPSTPVQRSNASPSQRAAIERLSATLPSAPAPQIPDPPSPRPSPRGAMPAAPLRTQDLDLGDDTEDTGSARSRWIAALVVAGVVVLLAATVGRRYLTRFQAPEAREAAVAEDPRVALLLEDGNRLLESGDWEGSRERLLKASALAEHDGRVLTSLARLESLRADQGWLELRLIEPTANDVVQAQKRELERRLARAEQAVNAALAAAPKEIAPARAEVDVLRMKGELAKARQKSAPLVARSTDPANAYVLAALDLAEDAPKWDNVIERLRVASNGEAGGGRAQATLVYALARAGRPEDAQSELAKIGPSSPMVPLLPELKAFVARAPKGPGATGSAKPVASAARAPAGDPNAVLDKARQATRSGQYAVAEELYYRVLERSPGNARALAGLAEIARRKNDTTRAEELNERARLDSPNAPAADEPKDGKPAAPKGAPGPGTGSNPSPTLPPEVDTTDLPGSKP